MSKIEYHGTVHQHHSVAFVCLRVSWPCAWLEDVNAQHSKVNGTDYMLAYRCCSHVHDSNLLLPLIAQVRWLGSLFSEKSNYDSIHYLLQSGLHLGLPFIKVSNHPPSKLTRAAMQMLPCLPTAFSSLPLGLPACRCGCVLCTCAHDTRVTCPRHHPGVQRHGA